MIGDGSEETGENLVSKGLSTGLNKGLSKGLSELDTRRADFNIVKYKFAVATRPS